MGCAASRLEDEEAVKMCRDRREFIKQALEQRNRFASSHIAYIESLKRVSMALQQFVAGDDHHELIFDTFISPVKQQKPEMLGLPYGSYEKRTIHVSRYLRSGPNPSVSVEEHHDRWKQSVSNHIIPWTTTVARIGSSRLIPHR